MNKHLPFLFVFALIGIFAWQFNNVDKTITWKLDDIDRIGEFKPTVLGKPVVKVEGNDTSIYFNGINDGLVIPTIPIEGWSSFTIEVLFKPEGDGFPAPRFIHLEDTASNRVTLELRLTKNGEWYFDGFLRNGKTGKGLTLIDSTKLHPVNRWYWASLAYDGTKMYSYINGKKELEGEIDFPAMTKGKISLGVRLNEVDWFKGQIKEIYFHPEALQSKDLQQF
jgi:Concanavalin A-like lectin/glucanases superfamily